jgi:starch phosphorylase
MAIARVSGPPFGPVSDLGRITMPNVRTFTVKPSLPEKLEPLRELAFNLRWSWDHESIDLFRRLDRDLWETCFHNPVLMLGKVSQERLRSAAADDGFIAHMERVQQSLLDYLEAETWYQKTYGRPDTPRVAYFSAEYGITESLPIYSGGLGVLSGDHLKSASDLGLPLVGVGLLYQEGYFRQYLNADGWQQESYPVNDFYNLPLTLVQGEDGKPLTVTVDLPGRAVVVQVWLMQVGRVPLYLLDTNIDANSREDQDITDALYGGGPEMRIKQEIIIGIGGVRALDAMGLRPDVCHMNEGHSAFLALERIRMLMSRQGFSFEQAREAAAAGNVFTTHTPVPAGIDIFAPDLVDEHFRHYYPALGLSRDQFLALGRENQNDPNAGFNMAVLAIHLSTLVNGVSQLHGTVARHMWQSMWPELPVDEVPIDAVTNGIHGRSWISHDMAGLYDRYIGPRWLQEPANEALWQRVDEIPDEELWRTHERRRERLVAFARRRLAMQLQRRGAPPAEVQRASEVLHPDTLTIGFARRFATYKRATLLFRDVERLARLLGNPEQPVQILFSGKAHPHDQAGKALIKEIVHHARREEFRNYIVFLEDYDMNVARYLVQGVDMWLNTPRRPREASGTSGMKGTVNGVLNLSIVDGWWAEAYEPDVGWAIGSGEEYEDPGYQDAVESAALYSLLEKEVVPLFYARGRDGLPREWIAKMKAAMRCLSPFFNTNRMVREYTESFYLPAAERYWHLMDQDGARAGALAQWLRHMYQNWPQIRVERVEADGDAIQVGDVLNIQAQVHLGALEPKDVIVQIYWGQVDEDGRIPTGSTTVMLADDARGGSRLFTGAVQSFDSGRFGYAVRVLPHHRDLSDPYQPGLVLWA